MIITRDEQQGIRIRRLALFLFPLAIILMTVVAYWPGLHGPYVLDDGENIVQNPAVAIHDLNFDSLYQALTSNESGPLKRPIAALSFALNHYFAGGFDDPLPFKLTNLIIHSINTVLVYLLAMLLLQSPALHLVLRPGMKHYAAGLVSAIWALHPLQLTSVLYVVQRMNSLSAMFVLSGLIVFCHGRLRAARGDAGGFALMYAGVGLGTLLGVGAKENAALLPLLALVIDRILFAGEPGVTPLIRRQARLFYALTVLVPLGAFVTYLFFHPEFLLSAYDQRHFTLWERLLTQSRVLWFYLGLLVLPNVRHLGLFHDDIHISHSLLDPLTTLPAVISTVILLAFAVFRSSRFPLLGFGVLWFLAGHSLESSIFGLEIAYEHRNYLPSFGVLFVLVIAGWAMLQKARASKFYAAVPMAVILVLAFVTWSRANAWSDIRHLAEDSVRHHPASPRANDFAARVALGHERNAGKALRHIMAGARAAPWEAGFLIDRRILLTILFHDTARALPLKPTAMPDQRDNTKTELKTGHSEKDSKPADMVQEVSDLQTIKTLLRERPISVHTIVSIENLSTCILEQPRLCATLREEALDWLTIAGNNTRTSPEYRAIIFSNAARLHASSGDYRRAYDYISRAIDVMPVKLSYQLGRIEYLIRLGRLSEAGNLLANADWGRTNTDIELSSNRDAILRLKTLYEEKTKAHSKTPGNK